MEWGTELAPLQARPTGLCDGRTEYFKRGVRITGTASSYGQYEYEYCLTKLIRTVRFLRFATLSVSQSVLHTSMHR